MNAESRSSDRDTYSYPNARMLDVTCRIDPEASAYLLPKPLRLSEPAMATLEFIHFPECSFGATYNEAAVWIHAEDDRGPAIFNSWIVVDDDEAMIGGRDVGCPKKMAAISLVEEGDRVIASVVRRGIEVLRMEATLGESVANPSTVLGSSRIVNAVGIPLTGMKLWDISPPGERIHEARHVVSSTLAVNRSDRDPLFVMGWDTKVVNALFCVVDISRQGGGGGATLTTDIDKEWIARNYRERKR